MGFLRLISGVDKDVRLKEEGVEINDLCKDGCRVDSGYSVKL